MSGGSATAMADIAPRLADFFGGSAALFLSRCSTFWTALVRLTRHTLIG